MYGLDNERRKMTEVKTVAGVVESTRTKYYSLNYEKEEIIINGTTTNREVNYIFAPDGLAAIYEKVSDKLYFVSSDALGSINMIVDETTGNIESDMSYDACLSRCSREGRRRNAQDWSYNNISISSITDRGYTMHEMLDKFDLINMNGRAYDPLVGQFLSADPFVQDPANPQSYNRYAYCLNNPLKYTDPSGYENKPFDWQWFITQNISSASLDYMAYMFHDRYNETAFTRQMQQSMNKIRAYRDWQARYEMFKKSYDTQSFLERARRTIKDAQDIRGRKVTHANATLSGDNPDILILTYDNGSQDHWANGAEIKEAQFEFKGIEAVEEKNIHPYFKAKPSGKYGPYNPDAMGVSFNGSFSLGAINYQISVGVVASNYEGGFFLNYSSSPGLSVPILFGASVTPFVVENTSLNKILDLNSMKTNSVGYDLNLGYIGLNTTESADSKGQIMPGCKTYGFDVNYIPSIGLTRPYGYTILGKF